MKKTHFTLNGRQTIELMLNEKKRFADIARAMERSKSAIAREVKMHTMKLRTGGQGFCYNNCVNRMTCSRTSICVPCKRDRKQKLCRRCNMDTRRQ